MEDNAPKVLISYTHDSTEHRDRVLALADRLRGEGINCELDQYNPFPREGWARWMQTNIDNADFVLIVCTETYLRRFNGNEKPGRGLGGQWEGYIITQELYEAAANNEKFIPIIFSPNDSQFIPKTLRASTHFLLDSEQGYDELYSLITKQPLVAKPTLGNRRILTPRNTPQAVEEGEDVAKEQPLVHRASPYPQPLNLTLLFAEDGKLAFVETLRIERGEDIAVELLPTDAREKAFLGGLTGQFHRPTIAIAFGDTAAEGQVENITTVHEGGQEIWKLKFRPSTENQYSPLSEFSFNGVTPEDIAELKARRILLDHKPDFAPRRNRLDDGMLESMIGNSDGLIKNVVSPLPPLYRNVGQDKDYFLAAARLLSILYLKLTGVVEHVFNLELSFEKEGVLRVSFEGQRPARYSNVPPQVIAFDGECKVDES